MTDPTNTDAQHPALVTATGPATPEPPTPTGTDDQHRRSLTRPGEARPPSA